jgi:hypothetical protein
LDQGTIYKRQEILRYRDQRSQQNRIQEHRSEGGYFLFFIARRGALRPQPVDQEDRQAHEDQRQSLRQRLCPA